MIKLLSKNSLEKIALVPSPSLNIISFSEYEVIELRTLLYASLKSISMLFISTLLSNILFVTVKEFFISTLPVSDRKILDTGGRFTPSGR